MISGIKKLITTWNVQRSENALMVDSSVIPMKDNADTTDHESVNESTKTYSDRSNLVATGKSQIMNHNPYYYKIKSETMIQ